MIRHKKLAVAFSIYAAFAISVIGVHIHKIPQGPKTSVAAADPCNNPYFDTLTQTNSGGTAVPGLTNAITIGNNANRVLYVAVGVDIASDANPTVSLSGVALTEIVDQGGSAGQNSLHVFRLIAPASGAGEIRCTWSSGRGVVVAVAYHNVDQTTPNDASSNASGTGTSLNANIASEAGDWVLAFIDVDGNSTLVPDSGDCNRTNVTAGAEHAVAFSEEDGTASVAIGWTWSGSQKAVMTAFNVNKAPAVSPFSFVMSTNAVNDGGNVTSFNFPTSIAAGELVVVWIKHEAQGVANVTAVAENAGNSFTAGTEQIYATSDASGQFWYLLVADGGGSQIDITWSGTAAFTRVIGLRYTYGGTASLSVQDAHTGNGTSMTTDNVSNSGTYRLNIAGYGGYDGSTITSPVIGGVAGDVEPNAQVDDTWTWWNAETLSTENATGTRSASGEWALNIICFGAN